MSHIFISYSRRDSAFVDRLAQDLERQGANVWVDRQDIEGGAAWRASITEAIRSCEAFLLVLSPASTASANVARELSLAEEHKRPILPLWLEACEIPGPMEYTLTGIQRIDFSTDNYDAALAQLIKVINKKSRTPDGPLVIPSTIPQQRSKLIWLAVVLGFLVLGLSGWMLYRAVSDRAPVGDKDNLAQITAKEARERAVRKTVDGLNARNDGNIEGACLLYTEAINDDPKYDAAYFYRGQAYVNLKKHNQAIDDFKMVLALSADANRRQDSQGFLQDLGWLQQPAVSTSTAQPTVSSTPATAPHTGAMPVPPNVVGRPSVIRPQMPIKAGAGRPALSPAASALVSDMFANDKSTRITATTKLILQEKNNNQVLEQAIAQATKQLNNKSGVINTLVYLENVPPATLRANRSAVTELLRAVRATNPGEQTKMHLQQVEQLL